MADNADATPGALPDVMTFFDVETADAENTRICQIGLMKITSDFTVLEKAETLVNPEKRFGKYQMEVHGVRPRHVKGRPNFKGAWDDVISGYFADGAYVVGHNIFKFDLSVLDKCCDAYGIRMPIVKYADTCDMSRLVFPNAQGHKLNLVCEYLGFEMQNHHDALYDVEATARAFFKMRKMRPECVKWQKREPQHSKAYRG